MLDCFLGALIGYLYGLSFVMIRRRVFSLYTDEHKRATWAYTFVLPMILRLALFASAYYYLLITDKIRFILTMICVITGYWIGILSTKATPDGRL
jgi:uncharacterized protein YqhQ